MPVLAPGVAASATHGLMRLAYAVLRADDRELPPPLAIGPRPIFAMRTCRHPALPTWTTRSPTALHARRAMLLWRGSADPSSLEMDRGHGP